MVLNTKQPPHQICRVQLYTYTQFNAFIWYKFNVLCSMAKSSAGFKNHFQIIFITLHFQQSFCRQWQKTRNPHTHIHIHSTYDRNYRKSSWSMIAQTDMKANHYTWPSAITDSMSSVGVLIDGFVNIQFTNHTITR